MCFVSVVFLIVLSQLYWSNQVIELGKCAYLHVWIHMLIPDNYALTKQVVIELKWLAWEMLYINYKLSIDDSLYHTNNMTLIIVVNNTK